MSKFLSGVGVAFLLLIGGCSAVPTIKNPFKYPYRIVPECSGRVTDLYGNPLRGVRIRIISYGKVTSAVSDTDGRFTLSPLYKWIGFSNALDIRDLQGKYLWNNESIAGKRHILFGELSLFFETPLEHFLLAGVNFFSAKYKNFRDYHTVMSYSGDMFCLCIPDANLKITEVPVIPENRHDYWNALHLFATWDYYQNCRTERLPSNPWDYLAYRLYKRISWEDYAQKRQIRTPMTIVTFDDPFVQWLKGRAVSKEMFETAKKRLNEPEIKRGMGICPPSELFKQP